MSKFQKASLKGSAKSSSQGLSNLERAAVRRTARSLMSFIRSIERFEDGDSVDL
jgi:hypothetical protein